MEFCTNEDGIFLACPLCGIGLSLTKYPGYNASEADTFCRRCKAMRFKVDTGITNMVSAKYLLFPSLKEYHKYNPRINRVARKAV